MKLQIIGSGAIFTKYASAATLIDNKILVDCGAGTFKQLLRLNCNVDEIDTILITHLHSDHFTDLPFMMYAASKNAVNGRKLTIYLPEGGIKAVYDIAKYLWDPEGTTTNWMPQNVELIEYQNDNLFSADGLQVEPVKVEHGGIKASGFIVEKDGKKIGFSGDSTMCDGIVKIAQSSDWVILDASCPQAGNALHMGLDDIYGFCTEYPNKKIITTHMYDESRMAIRKDIANLVVPVDGDVFEF